MFRRQKETYFVFGKNKKTPVINLITGVFFIDT